MQFSALCSIVKKVKKEVIMFKEVSVDRMFVMEGKTDVNCIRSWDGSNVVLRT